MRKLVCIHPFLAVCSAFIVWYPGNCQNRSHKHLNRADVGIFHSTHHFLSHPDPHFTKFVEIFVDTRIFTGCFCFYSDPGITTGSSTKKVHPQTTIATLFLLVACLPTKYQHSTDATRSKDHPSSVQ